MAIERRTFVERVLIVLDPSGALVGASAQQLSELWEDGQRISATSLAPMDVAPGDLATVLPDLAAATGQLSVATRRIFELGQAAEQAAEQAAAAVAERDRALGRLYQAETQASATATALAASVARVAELEAQVARLSAPAGAP